MNTIRSKMRAERPSFVESESGSASTEWMVAVSIVVMMAVPVLGLVGDGTGETSGDIAISIEETDSMGGSGFHGDEGSSATANLDVRDFVPGADMGVGFAEGEEEAAIFAATGATSDAPRLFAGTTTTVRRDKPTFTPQEEETEIVIGSTDRRPFAAPTPPVLVSQKLRVSDENCVEDIVAEVPPEEERNQVPIKIVVASGR